MMQEKERISKSYEVYNLFKNVYGHIFALRLFAGTTRSIAATN
jgi:hypothetical protein